MTEPVSLVIDRAVVERLYADLRAQYARALAAIDQARADANAIKGACDFADRLLNLPVETAGQPQLKSVECPETAHDWGSQNG